MAEEELDHKELVTAVASSRLAPTTGWTFNGQPATV
jgi:hypothetical protein